MLDQHNQLLTTDETLEARVVAIIEVSRNDTRNRAIPLDVLSLWEQLVHQLLLAGQLDLDMALTETAPATASAVNLKTVDCSSCLAQVDELNVAVEGLASNALHDDMDRLMVALGSNASVAAKKSEDLRTIDAVWNLSKVLSATISYVNWQIRFAAFQ